MHADVNPRDMKLILGDSFKARTASCVGLLKMTQVY